MGEQHTCLQAAAAACLPVVQLADLSRRCGRVLAELAFAPRRAAVDSGASAAVDAGAAQAAEAASMPAEVSRRMPDASLAGAPPLPPLAECWHFVNLTNGLEAVPTLRALGLPFQFVRCASQSGSRLHE